MDKLTVNKLIRERESTFASQLKEGAEIDDDIIKEILENAVWAPTHALTEPWFFKVYHKEGVNRFFDAQLEIYKTITPIEKQSDRKAKKYRQKPNQVSHVIAVCMKRDPKARVPEVEELIATACVVENIYLMLKPYGIAGYLSTGELCYTQEMKDFLELSQDEICLGFFQVGIAEEINTERRRQRISANEKTEWIG